MGIGYRLRQLYSILTSGPLDAAARHEIAAVLTPAESDLFAQLTYADQWHSVRVLRTLRDAGYNQPDLMIAALLHDVGKVRCPLSAWDRTVIVLMSALFPGRARRWGRRGSVDSWQRPFVAREQHPAWGAEMAAEAGSRSGVVELIRRHQEKVEEVRDESDQLLAYLQWADDQN